MAGTRFRTPTGVTPDLVAEIEFTEWTSDGKLRHPSYIGLRTDKDPRNVTCEKWDLRRLRALWTLAVKEVYSTAMTGSSTRLRVSMILPQKAGRSSGVRDVIRFPSRTTSSST